MVIALPSDVVASGESGGWNGRSVDDASGLEHPNTETAMDWPEHQRIVCEARGLLPAPGAEFNWMTRPNSDGRKAFDRLRSAYQETGSRSIVKVTKGIHQPTVNPHLQLRLETDYGASGGVAVNTFHLDVSAVDCSDVDDRFQWRGVRFSCVVGSTTYQWPENVVPVRKTPLARRNSISAADLDALITSRAETAAAAALAEALAAFAAAHGITARNAKNFARGRSAPGEGGKTYQYQKDGKVYVKDGAGQPWVRSSWSGLPADMR